MSAEIPQWGAAEDGLASDVEGEAGRAVRDGRGQRGAIASDMLDVPALLRLMAQSSGSDLQTVSACARTGRYTTSRPVATAVGRLQGSGASTPLRHARTARGPLDTGAAGALPTALPAPNDTPPGTTGAAPDPAGADPAAAPLANGPERV